MPTSYFYEQPRINKQVIGFHLLDCVEYMLPFNLEYEHLIEGYESPSYSDQDEVLLDQCGAHSPPPIIEQYTLPPVRRQPPPPRLSREQFRPRSASQLSFDKNYKRDRSSDRNFMCKKQYTFLSAGEMQQFQKDIKRGDLSKDELCNKYNVSISTTARFIRNFKACGRISLKKGDEAANALINKIIAESPHLRFEEVSQAIRGLQSKPPNSYAGTRFAKK